MRVHVILVVNSQNLILESADSSALAYTFLYSFLRPNCESYFNLTSPIYLMFEMFFYENHLTASSQMHLVFHVMKFYFMGLTLHVVSKLPTLVTSCSLLRNDYPTAIISACT
jgi:hypothetical protein